MEFRRVGFLVLPSFLLKDDWLISRLSMKLFFLSALLVVAMTPAFIGVDTTKMTFLQRLPWGILGVVGPFGLFFLWFGMWRYWVRLDDSKAWVKRVWFVVLFVGFWWGSVPFYFLVYLPRMVRRSQV